MMVARWSIDAKFGHKPEAIASLTHWFKEFGAQLGWVSGNYRILNGCIGALESTIISEININSLTELDQAWQKLAEIDGHKQWSKNLEQHIVSGTQKWEIFRVIDQPKSSKKNNDAKRVILE